MSPSPPASASALPSPLPAPVAPSPPPSSSSSSSSLRPLLPPSWPIWLLSGASAGLSVDLVLFPLDTIKTRMQSKAGLRGAGGFGKLFAGVASAAAGSGQDRKRRKKETTRGRGQEKGQEGGTNSGLTFLISRTLFSACILFVYPAPTAALFFFTYEGSKALLTPLFHPPRPLSSSSSRSDGAVNPLVHCLAASAGEVVACLIRVPTENVKQKVQAGQYKSSWECFKAQMAPVVHAQASATGKATASAPASASSPLQNFYRGFGTTICREIPFALIQFPLYEYSKRWLTRRLEVRRAAAAGQAPSATPPPLDGWLCACLGSLSGAVAAALTTPLDVAKTRLMLQQHHVPAQAAAATNTATATAAASSPAPLAFASTLRSLYAEGGTKLLFSGVLPRVMWISIGGFVFFGAYETTKKNLMWLVDERKE